MTLPLPKVDACYLCGIVEHPTSWNLIERTALTATLRRYFRSNDP
jgi:hypothetical protein